MIGWSNMDVRVLVAHMCLGRGSSDRALGVVYLDGCDLKLLKIPDGPRIFNSAICSVIPGGNYKVPFFTGSLNRILRLPTTICDPSEFASVAEDFARRGVLGSSEGLGLEDYLDKYCDTELEFKSEIPDFVVEYFCADPEFALHSLGLDPNCSEFYNEVCIKTEFSYLARDLGDYSRLCRSEEHKTSPLTICDAVARYPDGSLCVIEFKLAMGDPSGTAANYAKVQLTRAGLFFNHNFGVESSLVSVFLNGAGEVVLSKHYRHDGFNLERADEFMSLSSY
tara:strand:+ start:70 stop:909 length:840 start_codon:yes stop_codon:yes gene_type:complete